MDHQKTVEDYLRNYGWQDYAEYIKSRHWEDVKARYRLLPVRQSCWICDAPKIRFHHISYDRLGREQPIDILPLCNQHHLDVHRIHMRDDIPLKEFLEIATQLVANVTPIVRWQSELRRTSWPDQEPALPNKKTLYFEIDAETDRLIDALATVLGNSRNSIVEQAIRRFNIDFKK